MTLAEVQNDDQRNIMPFDLKLLKSQKLKRIEKNGVRYYKLPDGNEVPSVTTVLQSLSKSGIDAWKQRVGNDVAEAIVNKATARGTIIHSICENYIRNKPDYLRGVFPNHKSTFLTIRPILDRHISVVYGIESFLYSKKYKVAGTTDLICLWDGIPTVVDFKTAEKVKKESYLTNYKYQGTIYGVMANELYPKLKVRQVAIIIASDDSINAAVHKFPLDKYREETTKFFGNHDFC
jgi:hypothetical protein